MISRGLQMMKELGGIRPKVEQRKSSEFNVLEKVDLGRYPITKNWPMDGGKYITMPLVITKDPVTGQRNVGTYRMQVLIMKQQECTGIYIKVEQNILASIRRNQNNGCRCGHWH